ncbi:hypothetical protein [Halogeometricum borinquense]|uniref:hypothetical protein n=1 Tax=Halogeometricum borinquense TaxID=60847 RepID=UPI001EF7C0E7|nr:hypothetical protein [Halogeometricum borinquense]
MAFGVRLFPVSSVLPEGEKSETDVVFVSFPYDVLLRFKRTTFSRGGITIFAPYLGANLMLAVGDSLTAASRYSTD